MTKKVRNRLRPMTTWFGGAAWVPMAWRSRLRTMTMRVKAVISSSTAGRKLSAVKKSSVWIGNRVAVAAGALADQQRQRGAARRLG